MYESYTHNFPTQCELLTGEAVQPAVIRYRGHKAVRRGCKEKQTYVLKKRICKGHTGKGEQGSCNGMS